MKGLLKKEQLSFVMGPRSLKQAIIVTILVVAIAIIFNQVMIALYFCMFGSMLGFSSFALDSASNWDLYGLTLPTLRKGLVKIKYLNTILIPTVFLVSGTILYPIIFCFLNREMNMEDFSSIILMPMFMLSTILVGFPIIFKVIEPQVRTLAGLMIGMFISLFVGFLLLFIQEKFSIPNILFYIILCILLIVGFFISYKLSIKVYEKREF